MNRVDLVGRVTRDIELRYTETSKRPVVQTNVAINRTYTNQDGEREADFINVVIWDKQAENFAKYCKKGYLVGVEGRIMTRNYDDKDGKKVYVTEVVANRVEFLESKKDDSNFQNLEEPPISNNNNQISYKPEEIDSMPAFENQAIISDNDLPF